MAEREVRFARTERVILGTCAAAAVHEVACRLDAKRVLLIVSVSLRQESAQIGNIEQCLGNRFAATWSGIRQHVPESDVLSALAYARDVKPDLIVAIGGGSVCDAGKLVPLLMANRVFSIEQWAALRNNGAHDEWGHSSLEPPGIPLVAVPTTLSAAEFNPRAGALNEMSRVKTGYEHPSMAPIVIILDPKITLHTPSSVWFSTGIRALDHAIEALGSVASDDFSDGLACSAVVNLRQGLESVHAKPDDVAARQRCQIGAWQSVLPMVGGVPMGASHAIGQALGALFDIPHGFTSCVMLPAVLAWNAQWACARQEKIDSALGALPGTSASVLARLVSALQLPRRLGDLKIHHDQFSRIASIAFEKKGIQTNPRPITSVEDIVDILISVA
jgi:alcohol dehydrogenase class IV